MAGYEYNPLLKLDLQKKSAVSPSDIEHIEQEIASINEDITDINGDLKNKVPKFFTSIEELKICEIGEYQGETNETFINGDFYKRQEGVNEFQYTENGSVTLLREQVLSEGNVYQTVTTGICPSYNFQNNNAYSEYQYNNNGIRFSIWLFPESSNIISPYYVSDNALFGVSNSGYLLPYAYYYNGSGISKYPIRIDGNALFVQYNGEWLQITSFQATASAISNDSVYYCYMYQSGKLCPAWLYKGNLGAVYAVRNDVQGFAIPDNVFHVSNATQYLTYWNLIEISDTLYIPQYVNIPAILHVGFAKLSQGEHADSALQTVSASGSGYLSLSASQKSGSDGAKTQSISGSLTVQPLSTADAQHQGVAESSDVKDYIGNNTATRSQGAKADSALQQVVHGTDGLYVTTTVTQKANNEQTISTALTLQGIATADAQHQGVAEASDVRNYLNIIAATSEAYGVMWDTANPSPTLYRIGNMQNHALLPVQSQMIGGVMADDGTFTPFDNQADWTQATQARDGSDGQVMVQIPQHWRRSEMYGTYRIEMISPVAIPGYVEVRMQYVSAYEASLQRSTLKLASVNNSTADYRGGQNESSWDGTYRTLLNRPVTELDLTQFRTYARNRNTNNTKWNCLIYEAVRTIFWLFVTEYATLNSQADFNSALDANGFKQGGLGIGVSDWTGTAWYAYNGYAPFVPCGVLDEYGNGTAEKNFSIYNADSSLAHTFKVNKYRGIELPFANLWKHVDGVLINVESGNGVSTAYATIDTANFSSTSIADYAAICNTARIDSFIKDICFNANGDIFAVAGGGDSSSYYCDMYWGSNIPATGSQLRAWFFGGSALNGGFCGLACSSSAFVPGYRIRYIGSRLCFVP